MKEKNVKYGILDSNDENDIEKMEYILKEKYESEKKEIKKDVDTISA